MARARFGIRTVALLAVALLGAVAVWVLAAQTVTAAPISSTVDHQARNQNGMPAAPANLRVEHTDDGSRLTWDDPDDSSITGYEFRLRFLAGEEWLPDWTLIAGTDATTTTIVFTNLGPGLIFYVELRARDAQDPGDTADITFTTPGPPPPPPSPSGPSGPSAPSGPPAPPAPPAPAAPQNVIGSTPAATATELPGDRLRIERHDMPDASLELGIGSISNDCATVVMAGVIRDQTLGQTYVVVRREGDGHVVRRWVSPDSPLVYQIPWPIVNTQYTVPVGVVAAIPLDDQCPQPNLLARRFDGGDDRIFGYDADLQQWRHVPDIPTFQALGFYWCNVTAADVAFFDRITEGPAHPLTDMPARDDYPNCLTG